MNKKEVEEIYKMFAKAFHEVMPPLLEGSLKGIKNDMATKSDIDRLERKLDAHQERMDRHGKQLENHEERIHTLEV